MTEWKTLRITVKSSRRPERRIAGESIDSYDDLKKAFMKNYLQQKKCIKDPVEIHNVNQRHGESTKEFVRRYKLECRDVKGAPECMKISGFMHGITNPELIKHLHDNISKSVDEMIRVTTTFLKVGHNTDECMHLKRQIEEMLKAGKLSHLIKELKQNNRKDQAKAPKGENLRKGQATGNTNVATMAEGCQTKDHPNFLFGDSDLIPTPMGGGWDKRLRPEVKSQMVPAATPLVGFSGEIIWPLGKLSLLVKIGDEEHSTFAWMNFMVVRSPSSYIRIIGRPGQNHSTRMHDGLRTRSIAARNRPSHRRKDSSSNPPRISRTKYINMLYLNRRRTKGAVQHAKAKP
nr:reverse transcriptase domain-containing protein [Tanacetum cinerariifolium]